MPKGSKKKEEDIEPEDIIEIEDEPVGEENYDDIVDNDGDDEVDTLSITSEETSDIEEEKDEDEKTVVDESVKPEADVCVYNAIKREDEESKISPDIKIVKPESRITKPILTVYERVRILAERRQQLASGAKPMIKNYEGLTIKEISNQELKHKVIPFIISRTLPSGVIERWKLNELEIIN